MLAGAFGLSETFSGLALGAPYFQWSSGDCGALDWFASNEQV